jgi:methanogenic corrinoid protein MtbC1
VIAVIEAIKESGFRDLCVVFIDEAIVTGDYALEIGVDGCAVAVSEL